MSFRDGFLWGAATSAYQIEGAVAADGREPSIWDTFCHTPGAILSGDDGDVACDHYHRYREDVALMAQLGINAYRFSISWPRVMSHGGSAVNPAGLDFYSRLVDELLAHDIVPVATLYHWDLPQELQDAGGWTSRDTARRFAEYAAVIARGIGDRVSHFTTLNEPWCSAFLGHATGEHAPGVKDNTAALLAAHHLLLAHGLGATALRAALDSSAQVSITLNPALIRPASESLADRDASRRADLLGNRIFIDPLVHGHYPAELITDTEHLTDWSFVADGDLSAIAVPLDFLGVNYYQPTTVGAVPADAASPTLWAGADDLFVYPPLGPLTGMEWGIDAEGLSELLVAMSADFAGIPIMITENGSAFDDRPTVAGRFHDEHRARYLRDHIAAAEQAIEDGVDLRGYFVWSLLDNFEWAWGYTQRFGVVHVDFATQQRRLKHSAQVYQSIIAANAVR